MIEEGAVNGELRQSEYHARHQAELVLGILSQETEGNFCSYGRTNDDTMTHDHDERAVFSKTH